MPETVTKKSKSTSVATELEGFVASAEKEIAEKFDADIINVEQFIKKLIGTAEEVYSLLLKRFYATTRATEDEWKKIIETLKKV